MTIFFCLLDHTWWCSGNLPALHLETIPGDVGGAYRMQEEDRNRVNIRQDICLTCLLSLQSKLFINLFLF